MKTITLVLFVVCFCVGVVFSRESFVGHKLVRAHLTTQNQVRNIQNLNIDVWSHDSMPVLGLVDMRVSESEREELKKLGVNYEVLIEDIEALCEVERSSLENRITTFGASWYDTYHPYSEIVQHLQDLQANYPHLVEYVPSVGKTVEGRDIPGILVTASKNPPQFKFFFGGGQHAREWIAPATALYVTEKLITLYGTDAEATKILDSFLIVLVPLINVDGYEYAWNTNRLWRKNRRLNTGGSYGVDLNRNWDDHWCVIGASTTPSSDTYCGTGPFSEPETASVSTFVSKFKPIDAAVDYHSYGQLILRPYGWSSTEFPPTDAIGKKAGDDYAAAVKNVLGLDYTSQYAWQLYSSSGTSRDWFGSHANITRGYTIELRDTGTYGFQLPVDQIIPTGEENYAGVLSFAKNIFEAGN